MNNKHNLLVIIVSCVIITFLFNLLFGRYLTAKISTFPLFNKWQIISPQAPIVINTREEVRISDAGETLQAVSAIKSKISTIAVSENNTLTVTGGAVNLTSEGVFVSHSLAFAMDSGNYYIILNDGETAKIKEKLVDPATGLVFFKADLTNNVPAANLASSSDLKPGEKIFFISNSTQSSAVKFLASYVTFAQTDTERKVFDSDRPNRTFGAQSTFPLIAGQAIVSSKGDIVGLWNGNDIISSDVLKHVMALYFANSNKIIEPNFGFEYSMVNKAESAILNLTIGALVKDINSKQGISPAAKAGLLKGDIITKVNDETMGEQNMLEEILQKYKPGDTLKLEAVRGKNKLSLSLNAEELK